MNAILVLMCQCQSQKGVTATALKPRMLVMLCKVNIALVPFWILNGIGVWGGGGGGGLGDAAPHPWDFASTNIWGKNN